jgi:hypothetical protein|tara:strand:- start:36 stop:170 length:135 start_codon:yes stop_codon:yes gene_type:complete
MVRSLSTKSKWVDHGGNEKALTFVKLINEKLQAQELFVIGGLLD